MLQFTNNFNDNYNWTGSQFPIFPLALFVIYQSHGIIVLCTIYFFVALEIKTFPI